MYNDFFKHYQIGCWHYRSTTYDLKYDPAEVQKDLGMTYFTTPEHWHYGKTGKEEKKLDEYMASAKKLGMPVMYVDRRFFATKYFAKPSPEKARERLKFAKERYGDQIVGVFVTDEPWWGHMDEHKTIDDTKKMVDMVRDEAPDLWTFVALLGVADRYKQGKAELNDYIDTVHPDFLLYNVYSQLMSEDVEKEQGMINFYYQLYMYYETARERGIPLWASPMCTACWSFREPNKNELKWQLNVLAAHGVKGFVWYHLQETAMNPGQRSSMGALNHFDEKTYMYDWLKYENSCFKHSIISKLEGYELEDVYHYMFRQSNFKAWEFVDDDVIEDVRSLYHRHLIISKFKAPDGKMRIMITNGSQNENGNFSIKFKGELAKYNVTNQAGFLCPGGAAIIDLFDKPEDPADVVLD